MKNQSVFKLVLAGILIAVAVAASSFSIPVGVTKCLPVQHLVNVLAAVLLGPWYGVIMAFLTSLIRVALGTGSLLVSPAACAAHCYAAAYRYTGRLILTYLGETSVPVSSAHFSLTPSRCGSWAIPPPRFLVL